MRQFATPLLRARGIALQLRAIDEEHDRALDGDIRRELLLIFQESINNAVKHSGCSSIGVELTLEGAEIVLTVADDGRGFDTSVHVEGTGLSSIQKRAARLGGRCDISAAPGGGARVRISAPLRGRR
jgi:signal transduction histidine kinase